MEILAIGIYSLSTLDKPGHPIKLKQVQPRSDRLFQANNLGYFEKHSLTQFLKKTDLPAIYWQTKENEFHYAKKINNEYLAVIISKKDLHPTEDKALAYLFINIGHAFLRSETVQTTLEDIIQNPLRYIHRDIHLTKIRADLTDTKAIMVENIDKLLDRSEKLEELTHQTDLLKLHAEEFKRSAERLARCSC